MVGFAGFFATSGDVETWFRERGCIGVMGAELDLRRRLLVAVFSRSSSPVAVFLSVAGVGVFAASPRDLSVALIIYVANNAFSFADNSGLSSAAFFVPDVFDFVARDGFVVFESLSTVEELLVSLGRRRSLRRTVVEGEHVATEATAALTVSAWSWREAM